jgi:hypothetical protein
MGVGLLRLVQPKNKKASASLVEQLPVPFRK